MTEIDFTGSPAQNYRFKLVTPRRGATTVKISYSNAKTFGIYDTKGNYIAQTEYDSELKTAGPLTKSKCGENRFLPDKNLLEFYITSECIINIKPRNVI